MSKLIYFKRYLYVIDRLRSRSSNFTELQAYVIRKLENEDIDTPFEYSIRTFERDKKDILTLFFFFFLINRLLQQICRSRADLGGRRLSG